MRELLLAALLLGGCQKRSRDGAPPPATPPASPRQAAAPPATTDAAPAAVSDAASAGDRATASVFCAGQNVFVVGLARARALATTPTSADDQGHFATHCPHGLREGSEAVLGLPRPSRAGVFLLNAGCSSRERARVADACVYQIPSVSDGR